MPLCYVEKLNGIFSVILLIETIKRNKVNDNDNNKIDGSKSDRSNETENGRLSTRVGVR